MKTNVERLKHLYIYEDVKERTNLSDIEINGLSADRIVSEYCAWKLGNDCWWKDMKHYFDVLNEK